MPDQGNDPLLTEQQVADRTELKVKTLQQWRYKGKGPPYHKLGSAVRYRVSDVEAWLEERRVTSTTEADQKLNGGESTPADAA